MLISEIRGWHWAITWDNPDPPDSSKMLKALRQLGHLTTVQTKTTVLLAPKVGVGWRRIRKVIEANLNKNKGNAFYANLRTHRAFQRGRNTGFRWRKVG